MAQALFPQSLLEKCQVIDWGYTQETQAQSFAIFERWLDRGHFGALSYLSGERGAKRRDVKLMNPDTRSLLVFLFDYAPTFHAMERWYDSHPKQESRLASYALAFQGHDYHHVLKEHLQMLSCHLQTKNDGLECKIVIDTHPLLERDAAHRAGLGWFGKNSMLISRSHGSTFLIGSLLLNQHLSLPARPLESDHCGTCTACIQSCPTEAIDPNSRTLIADNCISTFTIELFKPAPAPIGYTNSGGDIFGCDICQEVCPWNNPNKSPGPPAHDPLDNDVARFFLTRKLQEILSELESMSNSAYAKKFRGTVLERSGRIGMIKNIRARLENA